MPTWLVVVAVIVGAAVAIAALHRAALWAESKGWLFYRSRPSGSASYAVSNVDVLFRPEVEHVIEARDVEAVIAEVEAAGQPPDPSGKPLDGRPSEPPSAPGAP